MKTSFLRTTWLPAALVLLAFLPSCIETALNLGPTRNETAQRNSSGRNTDRSTTLIPIRNDTNIFFSAVKFSENYDWQRDTAYGAVDYELLFYKDFELIFSVKPSSPRCFSPDFDTHHIIDGQLYTEYSDMSDTYIGLNGELLFSFTGREFLKGLVPSGGEIHTLTQNRSGQGFNYRKNGVLMEQYPSGNVFGSFGNPSYNETGAIYAKQGKLYFCYKENGGYYCSTGGTSSTISTTTTDIADAKFCYIGFSGDGENVIAKSKVLSGYTAENATVWEIQGEIWIGGYFARSSSQSGFSGAVLQDSGKQLTISDNEATVYLAPGRGFAVRNDEVSGSVIVYDSNGETQTFENYNFLSPSCAYAVGNTLLVGLSSRKYPGRPAILFGSDMRELDINGYITCVWGEISPAT